MFEMKPTSLLDCNPLVFACFVLFFGLFFQNQALSGEPEGKQVSALREYAYGKSGEWLYESLSKIHWPERFLWP